MQDEFIAIIRKKVPESERLAALAEEATELAHAALKMRRTLIDGNPTPVDYESAKRDLLEEIADLDCCIDAIGCMIPENMKFWEDTLQSKAKRWVERLEEKETVPDKKNHK